MPVKLHSLTPKQVSFCWGVHKGLSLAEAYRRAGYSKKGVYSSSSVLRHKPYIEEYIDLLNSSIEENETEENSSMSLEGARRLEGGVPMYNGTQQHRIECNKKESLPPDPMTPLGTWSHINDNKEDRDANKPSSDPRVSKERLIESILEGRDLALAKGNLSQYNKACELIARIQGHIAPIESKKALVTLDLNDKLLRAQRRLEQERVRENAD